MVFSSPIDNPIKRHLATHQQRAKKFSMESKRMHDLNCVEAQTKNTEVLMCVCFQSLMQLRYGRVSLISTNLNFLESHSSRTRTEVWISTLAKYLNLATLPRPLLNQFSVELFNTDKFEPDLFGCWAEYILKGSENQDLSTLTCQIRSIYLLCLIMCTSYFSICHMLF